MPIEHIKRERVHLVLDPRGFHKTVPVAEWFIGLDPAGGEDYSTVMRWYKDKVMEAFAVKEYMNVK
jgi:hypothetical protein